MTTMRIGLVWISQETSTFNPTPTTIESFAAFSIDRGQDILDKLAHVDGAIAGYWSVVSRRPDVETVPIFKARAVAGGRLSAETVAFLADELVEGLRAAGRLDGLALFLHGACSGEGMDDVDGYLLGLARGVVGPGVPIVLGLDHHANITEAMVAGADLIVGHRTQPHQPTNTGKLATEHLLRLVAGEVRPVTAWRKLPLISHQEQYLSNLWPMSVWFDRARGLEAAFPDAVIQISNFPMQPWLDVAEGGWATVVHTDGDQGLADRLADELADLAWSLRAEFQVKSSVPVSEAVAAAEAAERGVVVISDTGDSVLGGAGGDSTAILAEMIAQGISGPALVTLVQPDIAELVAGREVGEVVSLTVGGAVAGMHPSIVLTGTLRHLGPLVVAIEGFWSPTVDFGFGCVLETSFGIVVISERRGFGGVHPDLYAHFGLDAADFKMAVVKTASNFQFFAPISSQVIRADTPGPTQSDMASLPWERIPRPIYPLDDLATWR
jgi:microcystin degradation protein MlrC